MREKDRQYMTLALEMAKKGQGRTSPNPCVGAVIVYQDSVVGKGYHKKAGTPHAEIHAITDAGVKSRGSTLYVTLEPCNHTGRTSPCTHAILEAGIARVVVGMPDPNPTVKGGGNKFLESNGVIVESGVLEPECRDINHPFIKHSSTGTPWVIMKAGISLDGKISYRPGRGGQITGKVSSDVTHTLRDSLDAILVGVETAIIDNPFLTTRLKDGTTGRDPVRVILDTNLRLPPESRMLHHKSEAPTWIFCSPHASEKNERLLLDNGARVTRVQLDDTNQLDLHGVLSLLGQSDITSILVEGGSKIHGSFLHNNLVDEVFLFVAPFFIGEQGTSLLDGFACTDGKSRMSLERTEVSRLGDDMLLHGFFTESA